MVGGSLKTNQQRDQSGLSMRIMKYKMAQCLMYHVLTQRQLTSILCVVVGCVVFTSLLATEETLAARMLGFEPNWVR